MLNNVSKDYIEFTRYDLINYIIDLYGYKSYLEIGCAYGGNFNKINITNKTSVDPHKHFNELTHEMTSDEFFEINKNSFDIIFIDGLHLHEQVIKDIHNSLEILNSQGTIVMHDCLPNSETMQNRSYPKNGIWCGDVWKAFVHFRKYDNLTMFTINTDHGMGIVKKGNQEPFNSIEELTWKFYTENVSEMMIPHGCYEGLEKLKTLKSMNL